MPTTNPSATVTIEKQLESTRNTMERQALLKQLWRLELLTQSETEAGEA